MVACIAVPLSARQIRVIGKQLNEETA